jgi:glycosyltransferase involved in cell wall biosynthesis
LHLGKFYPPHPGGIERFTAELAAAQTRAGLVPAVLAHAAPRQRIPLDVPSAADPPFPVQRVACHGQLLFVPLSPGWPLAMRRMLSMFRPHLLHIHLPNPSAFWLLAMPQARALPWVLHWHADVPADTAHRGLRLAYPLYRHFEGVIVRRAQAVIATSASYRDASRPLQAAAGKSHVVPLGIDAAPAVGVVPTWPGRGLRLLAVGRLSYYKGFDCLIDAMAAVPDASLLLIGSGEQHASLQQQVDRLGLGDRVRLAGHVDDPSLEAAYRACDVFCLPSVDRAEAFGMVLLEAMRAGKPVLASDIPGSGVGEVVEQEVTGRLLRMRDIDHWTAAIRAMADDPAGRAAMGAAGYRRWAERFRIEPVAAQITPIYRALVDEPAPAAAPTSRPAAAPGAAADD